MSRKPNNYNKIIHILQELHTTYPSFNLGRHISTAFSEYGDLWGVSDKELLYALEKYKEQLEMDIPRDDEEEIERITNDALSLNLPMSDSDDEDDEDF